MLKISEKVTRTGQPALPTRARVKTSPKRSPWNWHRFVRPTPGVIRSGNPNRKWNLPDLRFGPDGRLARDFFHGETIPLGRSELAHLRGARLEGLMDDQRPAVIGDGQAPIHVVPKLDP